MNKIFLVTACAILLMASSACKTQSTSSFYDARVANQMLRLPSDTTLYFAHYHKRYAQFQNEPAITPENIVFLGNSLTENAGDWGKRLGWTGTVNRGIIGDEVNGIFDRLHQILPGHPKEIFLLCGVNDISHHLSSQEIASRMERVIERIQAESPQTKLYLESCIPINESFGRYKNVIGKTDQVPELNELYRQIAKRKGIPFINIFPLFVKPGTNILRADLTHDGLHLTNEGYDIWVNALHKFLKR